MRISPYWPQYQQPVLASNLHGKVKTIHGGAQIQIGGREFRALRVSEHHTIWGLAHAPDSLGGIRFAALQKHTQIIGTGQILIATRGRPTRQRARWPGAGDDESND